MATVALRSLSRHYKGAEQPALEGLDLDVRDGELLVLVGPSGCGKSTALRLVAGLDSPDGGGVHIDGRDVTQVAPQDRDVAMVFQGYALYPHLSARDNIAFPLKMRGVPSPERARKIAEVADLLGISRLLDRRPGELSGGERQRVAMGRAIVRSPKVFLFDEPLSNLDAALRAELRVELSALVRRLGTTSLYVTHDQTEAMTMGDRIAVMRGGRLQQVGSPRAIYESPVNTFVAGFLGSPPINLVPLQRDGDALSGAGARWPAPAGPELPAQVLAGVRPENLALARPSAGAVEIGARVLLTEPLGAETHLMVDAAGVTLRTKTAGFDAPARDEAVQLFVDPRAILYFDAQSGERLVSEQGRDAS
jgi:multiple sugar transport system ATP-binding protein